MTAEFLFYANLVLVLRLWLLLTDTPAGARAWLRKGVVEIVALGLFAPQLMLGGVILIAVAVNFAGGWWDRRLGERNGGHLLIGGIHLLLLSVFFSPAAGVSFAPGLLRGVAWMAGWTALGGVLAGPFNAHVLKVIFGLLLAANEANLAIRAVLGGLQLKPGRLNLPALDRGEYNRGRVIGLLERVLIYCFVLSGQFGAIGFTLAAKGFTRFKELEDRGFAEYVLIGTLLSSGLAMAAGVLVRFGL
jgi:hypothetical protein